MLTEKLKIYKYKNNEENKLKAQDYVLYCSHLNKNYLHYSVDHFLKFPTVDRLLACPKPI